MYKIIQENGEEFTFDTMDLAKTACDENIQLGIKFKLFEGEKELNVKAIAEITG